MAARDIASVDDLEVVVRRFYTAAIPDPLLGPVFEAFGVDWSSHIPTIVAFWARDLLGVEGYRGNVARAHARVLAVAPFGDAHLARWVELFTETVDEHHTGPVAERAKDRARRVASVLATIAGRGGEVPGRGLLRP